MKLYDSKTAPNPRRVRIFLAEKGVDIPVEQVDLMKFGCQTDEFTAKNPMQRVPVLELDDGTCISESVAICRYIEEVHPEPALFGTTPVEKAEIEMWNRRVETHILQNVTNVFRNTSEAMAHLVKPQVPEWAAACRPKLDEDVTWLDGVMADREFIAGDKFSIADITAICGLDFMRVTGKKLDNEPNLTRWRDALKARPSYMA